MKKNTRHIHIKREDIADEAWRLYIEHLLAQRYSDVKLRIRYMALKRFFAWMRKRGQTVRDITPQDLDKYHARLRKIQLSVNTVFQEMAVVRSIFHPEA